MFGLNPNIDGTIVLSQNLITGSDDGAIATGEDKTFCNWHADGGANLPGSLIFSAERANAIYSGTTLQLPALQTLICIKA